MTGCPLDSSPSEEPGASRGDRFARWWLGGGLAGLLSAVALVQLASWIPHYLTWPYWADHDVFANIARAWSRGELPYRDNRLNNFPGTVYLFWVLGKLAGWGRPAALFAADAGLLVVLGLTLVAWSRRRFDRVVPGLIAYLALLSYYLGLDYAHAAQRDWHSPCLAVLALMVAQGWSGRRGLVLSALLAALALSIRPQAVLFLPALIAAVAGGGFDLRREAIRRVAIWGMAFASFAFLAFLPLLLAGVFGDFLESLRLVSYGSTYNKVGPSTIAKGWLLQAAGLRWWVVPAAILLIGPGRREGVGSSALPWLLALAGVSLYKPASPVAHTYLDIPLMLAWSVNLAVLADRILASERTPASFRLAAVLALLGLGETTLRPEFSIVGPNLRAWSVLRSGTMSEEPPPGYRKGTVGTSAYYPWKDYRAALLYLKANTGPETKVANCLMGDPAVVSVVDRPSAFPAEAITWLRIGRKRDEAEFADRLEAATDSVVVWVPGEVGLDPDFRIDLLARAIRRLFRFEARFGKIEVWRRDPTP